MPKFATKENLETIVDALRDEMSDVVTDPTDAGPIVELTAKGWAEQNGTPSPDSPVDIEVVRGKNLLPCTVVTTTNNGITFTVNPDGTIVANGTVSYSYATLILLNATKLQSLPVIGKSVTLTLSGCPAGGGSSTHQLAATLGDGGTTTVLTDDGAGATHAFTNVQCPSAGNVFIRIYGNGRTVNNLVFKPQLEIGSVATPYVPHGHIVVDVSHDGTTTAIPIPLPERGYVAALPDGTCDTLALDGAGGYEWTLNTRMTTQAVTDGVTGTVGVNVMSSTGQIADGATVLYKDATTTESGYVSDMPTVPVHAKLTTDLHDLAVRCCADDGAAEIASAWGKRYESRIANLESAVAELVANG